MISRKTPDLENKLLILYAVDQLGPLTSLQLLQFLAEHSLMDYITMQLILGDMMAAGHLSSTPHALGTLYTLSQVGRESLHLFLRRLPHSTKSLVRNMAAEWKLRFARETQMLADFHRREDGMYDLRLRLMEKDSPLLDMTLALPTRDLADQLSRRWPLAAPSFYGYLMKELGDAFTTEAACPSEPPPDAFIETEIKQGCMLHLKRSDSSAPPITLAMALPTRSMALFFAWSWSAMADDICSFLMNRLSEE